MISGWVPIHLYFPNIRRTLYDERVYSESRVGTKSFMYEIPYKCVVSTKPIIPAWIGIEFQNALPRSPIASEFTWSSIKFHLQNVTLYNFFCTQRRLSLCSSPGLCVSSRFSDETDEQFENFFMVKKPEEISTLFLVRSHVSSRWIVTVDESFEHELDGDFVNSLHIFRISVAQRRFNCFEEWLFNSL